MGHQILILALTGTHNPALTTEITQMLSQRGLEIRHACLTYEGQTAFAIGTPDALASELAEAGHEVNFTPASLAQDGTPTTGITLETVLEEVRAHRSEFQAFARYEKKDDKSNKGPKPPKLDKKEAPPEAPKVEPQPKAPEVKPEEKTAEEQSQQQDAEGQQKAPPEA